MILWFQRLPNFSKQTDSNMIKMPGNGVRSMQCSEADSLIVFVNKSKQTFPVAIYSSIPRFLPPPLCSSTHRNNHASGLLFNYILLTLHLMTSISPPPPSLLEDILLGLDVVMIHLPSLLNLNPIPILPSPLVTFHHTALHTRILPIAAHK
jgi:hypothetical protein